MLPVLRSLFIATLACSALVACQPGTVKLHESAESYIRAHIGELSTEQPVLGGTFYVTEIKWLDDATAHVEYEDGHIALSATAELRWASDGSVTISRFVVDPQEGTYRNDARGYSFAYPGTMRLHEYSTDAQTVGTETGDALNGMVEVRVLNGGVPAMADSRTPEAFIETSLLRLCDADGPDASISCTGVARRETLATAMGVSAQRYTLTEVETALPSGDKLTRTKGPFIVINLPQSASTAPITALVISGPLNVPSSRWDTTLITDVVDSVRVHEAFGVTSSMSSDASSSIAGRPLSTEGEFCGGIAAFQCDTGLTCKYDGTYPDAGGTCVKDK